MVLHDTYIVTNPQNMQIFRKLNGFKMDLGRQLLNESPKDKRFRPGEVKVQTHMMFFNELILKCGTVGTLEIYSNNSVGLNTISVCNGQVRADYTLDVNLTLYDNLNTMLDQYMADNGMRAPKTTEEPVVKTEVDETTVVPTKPLSEMTMEERVAYARSRS